MSIRGGRKVLFEIGRFIELGFMFMLTFSVNFNVNIVGARPFIHFKIAGLFTATIQLHFMFLSVTFL